MIDFKSLVLLIAIAYGPCHRVAAQVEIHNLSLTQSSQKVLFSGEVDNFIKLIFTDEVDMEDYSVKLNSIGKVRRIDYNDCHFAVSFNGTMEYDTIQVYFRDTVLIYENVYEIRQANVPNVNLGNSYHGILKKLDNCTDFKLNAVNTDALLICESEVVSYRLTLFEGEELIKQFPIINDNFLTKKQVRAIKRLSNQGMIKIDEISILSANSSLIKRKDILLKVQLKE
ncbi:MAG: hypothetical protein QNK23_16345 [Crocinitomicaceae bacterium]|nr:hypothetical protein [Crocinitomicaceae bacterium]